MITRTPSVHIDRPPGDVADWLLRDVRTITPGVDRTRNTPDGHPAARPLEHLSRIARAALGQQIVVTLRTVLRADLVDLLLQGWRKHRTLAGAAAATVAEPETQQLVTLAEHRVRWAHEPTLEVILDGVPVLTLTACLEVLFDIGEVVAVVRAGRLIAVRAGSAAVTGSVTVQDQQISRRTVHLPLHLITDLGPGLALTTSRTRESSRGPAPRILAPDRSSQIP